VIILSTYSIKNYIKISSGCHWGCPSELIRPFYNWGVTIDKSLGEDNVIAVPLSILNDMDILVSHTVTRFGHKNPVFISIMITNIIFNEGRSNRYA
jgi:hypothetical protein